MNSCELQYQNDAKLYEQARAAYPTLVADYQAKKRAFDEKTLSVKQANDQCEAAWADFEARKKSFEVQYSAFRSANAARNVQIKTTQEAYEKALAKYKADEAAWVSLNSQWQSYSAAMQGKTRYHDEFWDNAFKTNKLSALYRFTPYTCNGQTFFCIKPEMKAQMKKNCAAASVKGLGYTAACEKTVKASTNTNAGKCRVNAQAAAEDTCKGQTGTARGNCMDAAYKKYFDLLCGAAFCSDVTATREYLGNRWKIAATDCNVLAYAPDCSTCPSPPSTKLGARPTPPPPPVFPPEIVFNIPAPSAPTCPKGVVLNEKEPVPPVEPVAPTPCATSSTTGLLWIVAGLGVGALYLSRKKK